MPHNTRWHSTILPTLTLIAFIVSMLISCTGAQYTYPTLVGKGILPLSTTNAYQGANLFLAKEMEKSSYLFRFVEKRGAPAAIEIQEEVLGKPELYLYYTPDNAVYVADLRQHEQNRQWIVRGPYGIDRHHYKVLNEARNVTTGIPVFDLYGSEFRFNESSDIHRTKRIPIEPDIPYIPVPESTPLKAPKPKSKATPEESTKKLNESDTDNNTNSKQTAKTVVTPKIPGFDDKNFIPHNSDQRALLMAQGYAPRNEQGDILHTVRHDRDTLSVIVEWYTGTRDNYAAIMRLNGIDDSKPLKKGEVVRIPKEMITRTKLLPDD